MIVVLAVLLALIVGIVIFITPNKKGTDGKNSNTKTEQGKEDAVTKDDKEETDKNDEVNDNNKESDGLEVLKPNEVVPENSTDTSGSWGETSESNTQTGNKEPSDKTDQEEEKENEDILEDDILWGDIY